ncbi:unnamed protein product [Phyllotreta striolata]|uniref:Uncharacterized protein n=1 Tax=Phyllotreta striolata TaxID=444603 RepID=A0A9P0DTH8_PHYSR|nr:unnamed protein product [Phyllotreta striolata]
MSSRLGARDSPIFFFRRRKLAITLLRWLRDVLRSTPRITRDHHEEVEIGFAGSSTQDCGLSVLLHGFSFP